MGEARKIIDWRGQDAGELASALFDVPKGRYVLVPEEELAADAAEVDAINEGIDAADRGELADYEDVRDELDSMITRARTARGR